MSVDLHSRVLSGTVFQTDGAATKNVRQEIWVIVLGTDNRGTWEERSSLGGSTMWISSLKYAGVDITKIAGDKAQVQFFNRVVNFHLKYSTETIIVPYLGT